MVQVSPDESFECLDVGAIASPRRLGLSVETLDEFLSEALQTVHAPSTPLL
jgi:hypothetical protein